MLYIPNRQYKVNERWFAKSSRPGGVEGGQFKYYQAENLVNVWILNFSPDPTFVATIYSYTPPPPPASLSLKSQS